jgi:hypothetical protein
MRHEGEKMPNWIKALIFVAGIIGILWLWGRPDLWDPKHQEKVRQKQEEYEGWKKAFEEEHNRRMKAVQEASKKEKERTERALQKAIKECIEVIRAKSNYSHFDAYPTETTVNYFGTSEERFQFEKCMAGKGHALGSRE